MAGKQPKHQHWSAISIETDTLGWRCFRLPPRSPGAKHGSLSLVPSPPAVKGWNDEQQAQQPDRETHPWFFLKKLLTWPKQGPGARIKKWLTVLRVSVFCVPSPARCLWLPTTFAASLYGSSCRPLSPPLRPVPRAPVRHPWTPKQKSVSFSQISHFLTPFRSSPVSVFPVRESFS